MQETNKKVSGCNGECSSCESSSSCSVNNFQLKLNEYSHIKTIIGVVSGKGGVGKSMISSCCYISRKRIKCWYHGC